ncbi:DUF2070 family protein [Archaeoglobus sp.]
MNTEALERLHRIAFSTPNLFTTMIILCLSFLIIYELKFGILNFIAFSIALALFVPILNTKFNLRRYSFFIAFVSVSTILINTLSKYINTNPVGIFIAFITTTVLYFTSEAEVIKVSIASSVESLLLYPNVATILGVLLGIIFIKFMNREINGYNVRLYFKRFLLSWLTNDPSYFEDVLKSEAVRFKGWVKCLRIGKAKLVTTSFHPGPLRNIGGAKLVERINSIENAVFLHSPTDHSLNPVSADEVEKIIASICCNDVKLKPMKPFDLESDNYILRVFPFDKVRLMFVIGKNCIDDLPYDLNVDGAMVVDAHNAHCEVFRPNLKELKELVRKGIELERELCEMKYAFRKFRVETNSICGSVAILLLDYGFERYAIVVVDGNNVKLGFRKEIEDFCAKKGFKAIVASTDNHSKTGVNTKFTYLPVGSDERDRVIFEMLEECFKLNFEDCDVYFAKREVEIDVVGEKFCRFIDEVGRFGLKVAKLYFSLLSISFALSIIL